MFGKAYPQEAWEDCLTITNGKKYPDEYLEIGTYPICGSGGIMGYGDHKLCSKDTIILGRKGNINSPIYMETDYWIVDTAFSLDVDCKKLHPKYFYYWCVLFDFTKYNKQGVLPSLTKNDLLKIEISIPPMNEQIKFVQILDQADKSKFTSLKSQFIEMFGSNDCECKPLSDLTSLITKGTTPTSVGFNFEEDGIKYIKAENICEDTSINLNDCMHISQDCHNTLKRSQLQNGDLLFSIAGVIGRVGVITKECLPANTNQALAIIRFDTSKEINKEYAKHALLSSFVESQWKMKMRGAAQMNISLKDVGDINIPLPSLANQEQFCQIAEQADKSKYIN